MEEPIAKKAKTDDEIMALTTRTGGAYIPPARLRALQAQVTDKSSVAYQRISWEALKKSLHGMINKINVENIVKVTEEILKENIVRGRGLLVKSCIDAQTQSPTFTHVYAALIAVINTKFPQIGELILKRLINNFRKGYRRNQKTACLSACRFIAHLVNQQVADEIVALEIVTLLLENHTLDSIELAVGFLKECGNKLQQSTPKGLNAIFDQFRTLAYESDLDKRVGYMLEVLAQIRKDGFKDHPAVAPGLDLVDEEDQFTHTLTLEDEHDSEDILNVFKFDPEYEVNEDKYKSIRKQILGESESEGEEGESDEESDEEKGEKPATENDTAIVDSTETNLVALRRNVYLTIQSSLNFEECVHKLLKLELKPGQETEICHMIVDCCAQQRTYEKFFGLLAGRFCQLHQTYIEPYQKIFIDSYDTIHRLETNKLRNVAKFFAHLLWSDAISWLVLGHIKLSEEDTTSSSRIFVKILFQELAEFMGMKELMERISDPALQEAFEGLFPRNNPKNTRFAINFFTSIGLGGLTDALREHLSSMPKPQAAPVTAESEGDSSSDSESDSSSGSSDSSSTSSESEQDNRRKMQPLKKAGAARDFDRSKRPRRSPETREERRKKESPKVKQERKDSESPHFKEKRRRRDSPDTKQSRRDGGRNEERVQLESRDYRRRSPERRRFSRDRDRDTDRSRRRSP
ncbi:pre-mRNA-splicing factor CWC22 homolog [Paramacrobiotus metropolitanus]|uniref:pre-mRNA-splicing factor CWC22 homolog n=1 Tax=Paramacrobiotus metropolitanus TaxID=2943436 RepID=UPI002445B6C5|nr:pre-mRNA-splicing factor CWC22 homolog [Paramacrobiotus metropolitanus]